MDLHNKKLFGSAYDVSMTSKLAITAVENACLNIKETEGIHGIFSFDSKSKKEEVNQTEYSDSKTVK